MSEIDYTIAAIPNVYKGRQYRSRLEARWAAFFDLMKWKAEYEPFDLGEWSPDFSIRALGTAFLTEIKPAQHLDAQTAEKMVSAVRKKSTVGIGGVLYCGLCPELDEKVKAVRLGWVNPMPDGDFEGWRPNYVCFLRRQHSPSFATEFCRRDFIIGDENIFAYPEFVSAVWAEATNLVQWRAPK